MVAPTLSVEEINKLLTQLMNVKSSPIEENKKNETLTNLVWRFFQLHQHEIMAAQQSPTPANNALRKKLEQLKTFSREEVGPVSSDKKSHPNKSGRKI